MSFDFREHLFKVKIDRDQDKPDVGSIRLAMGSLKELISRGRRTCLSALVAVAVMWTSVELRKAGGE